MTLALGCIADDYTGASDLANTLTKAGLRTVQTIGVPGDLDLPEVDAVVVALKSRSIEAGKAVALSRSADQWLRARGADHVLFKICSTFDSTDAGNIGPVTDALQADSKDPIVLVTPAFPETGRTVYQGNLFVGSVPLNESPLKDHPLNPMHDANLVRVLARQSRNKTGLVDIATVSKGRRCGSREAQAACGVGRPSGGCGRGVRSRSRNDRTRGDRSSPLGRRIGYRARSRARSRDDRPSSRIGSECVLARRPGRRPRRVPCRKLLAGDARADRCGRAARCRCCGSIPTRSSRTKASSRRRSAGPRSALGSGPILIASSSAPDKVAAVQARHGRDAAGHAIEQAFAALAVGLVERGVRRLIVAGGETSGAVVDRLGIPAFLVGPEIAAGVPVLRTAGMKDREMVLALKSGNFGGPTFFSDALKLVQ